MPPPPLRRSADAAPRLEGLDALRGLAALAVVLYHTIALYQLPIPTPLRFLTERLGMAVPLFFVLSAFSLYFADAHRMRTWVEFRDFHLRRFFRIAPLFYTMIALVTAMRLLYLGQPANWRTVAVSSTLLFNLFPAHAESTVWAGWSIGVEYLFYLVLPVLFRVVGTGRRAAWALAIAAVASLAGEWWLRTAPWSPPGYAWISAATSLVFFAVGMAAFFAHRRLASLPPRTRQRLSLGLIAGAGAGLWVAFAFANRLPLGGSRGLAWYLSAFPFGLVVLAFALWPWRLVVNRATVFAGAVSYSIYLVHTPAILLLWRVTGAVKGASLRAGLPETLVFIPLYALVAGIVVAVSWLTHRVIEQPGMRLGKRLTRRLAAAARA